MRSPLEDRTANRQPSGLAIEPVNAESFSPVRDGETMRGCSGVRMPLPHLLLVCLVFLLTGV